MGGGALGNPSERRAVVSAQVDCQSATIETVVPGARRQEIRRGVADERVVQRITGAVDVRRTGQRQILGLAAGTWAGRISRRSPVIGFLLVVEVPDPRNQRAMSLTL